MGSRSRSDPRRRRPWTAVAATVALPCVLPFVSASTAYAHDRPEWVRPLSPSSPPRWGLRGGLQFGLHPGVASGKPDGPRGLIRIYAPVLPNGGYDLVNFLAVEPVVARVRCFSELEPSASDGAPGKAFTVADAASRTGSVRQLSPGTEVLEVPVRVERFVNGAHVRLILRQRSDRPDELEVEVRAEPGSAPMER